MPAARPRTVGPVLGPGPVAETFPDSLTLLEQDLWVAPLKEGVAGALALVGAAPARRLKRSPVVTVVRSRVVADLVLLGHMAPRHRYLALLDPRPPFRRMAASWRTGRLKTAFGTLARDLVERTDAELAGVPPLAHLEDITLLRALDRTGLVLRALHAHEVLAGQLLEPGTATAAASALRALARARVDGVPDRDVVAADPVILALVPPSVGKPLDLPPVPPDFANDDDVDRIGGPAAGMEPADLREALRLRARWVQELSAKIALELGRRATERGSLPIAAAVRHVTLAELHAIVLGDLVMLDPASRAAAISMDPVPAAFRLTPDGEIVPEQRAGKGAGELGDGVSPGKGVGPAHVGGDWPPDGAVLVVPTLDPRLAMYLPGLAAVVSETGTAMSHVAIVARELGVPVVVGIPDAASRFADGVVLEVDGDTGAVTVAARDEEAAG